MDFSLKRWGAHFCPPPIWAAKKACFLPPFQVFGHVAHMFFRFLLHRFCVFLHDFCIFSHFLSNFLLEQTQIGRFREYFAVFLMIIPCKFRIIFRPVRLKLSSTPSCMVDITQHALKGQKLLAQGNALGINDIQLTPCKGKSFTYRRGFSHFY